MGRSIFVLLAIVRTYHIFVKGVVVKIQQGELKGTQDISRAGLQYFSFRGVPYAKPPLDDLRFQGPQIPPEPWVGIRDAEKYGNDCPQFTEGEIKVFHGNEDCLFLNVFTPQVNTSTDRSGLPVMVWIHGGGLRVGAGSYVRPDYVMDKPVVLVTINYRLGALGFLCLDDELTGNYGMKDQVAALRWVQNNIRAFGGDPGRVTIAGQSAGGTSVHWHMFSKSSDDLFHRAISQSGVLASPRIVLPRRIANDRGLMVTRLLGCNYELAAENVKCLKRIPAYELVKAQEKSAHNGIVAASVDESAPEGKSFGTNVSWLVGVTSEEDGTRIASLLKNHGKGLKEFSDAYQMRLPDSFVYGYGSPFRTENETTAVTKKILEFYFKNETINNRTVDRLEKMFQEHILYRTTEAALRHRGRTYFYVFDHLLKHPWTELSNKEYKPTGAVHCDDIISLFKIANFPQHFNAADRRVSEHMINMWTNFMATGDPNSANLGFQWSPLSGSKIEYLSINEYPKMKSWYWENGTSFWRSLNLCNKSRSIAESNLPRAGL